VSRQWKRREFITLLGAAAVWPLAARAQQSPMPVIGFLHGGTAEQNANRVIGFRKGLSEAGFVEGQNVTIEFHWADGQNDRLPELATDLIRRRVAVIATLSSNLAAVVAKAGTTTIPIVFTVGADPVEMGLVASLSRPGGNVTGISTLNAELTAKRLGLLHELAPQAANISVLLNPTNPSAEPASRDLQATARTLGLQINVVHASNDREIDVAFADLALKAGSALLVSTDPFFFIRRAQLVALAARHAVPTIYYDREFTDNGGLVSYGTSVGGAWEQAGIYVGRILKGEKPADLPVAQATKFEMVINLKTAKALGITMPNTLLSLADEVIE
jgi:putative ABC transport system substrate-binding protein